MGFKETFERKLVSLSVADAYGEVMLEWDVATFEAGNIEKYCLCGHKITQNCMLKNRLNSAECIVGNCCVKRFLPQEQVEKASALRKEAVNKTKQCALCEKRYRKADAHSKSVCNNCFSMNLCCQKCSAWFYCSNQKQRDNMKLCGPCWQREHNYKVTKSCSPRTGKRTTKDCPTIRCKSRISLDDNWKSVCSKCFKRQTRTR